MNQETKTTVDQMLSCLISTEALSLYARWKREYKDRVLDVIRDRRAGLPSRNSDNPGFEMNIIRLLCNHLNDHDPHCEWPYASYMKGSREHVDLHIVRSIQGSQIEFWLEVGMYASDEKKKYRKDFYKLLNLLSDCNNVIGVMAHVEIFPKGIVFPLFQSFADNLRSSIELDVSTIGDQTGTFVCRAIMSKREAEPTA